MSNNTFKLTKIPLEYIVQLLTHLYEEGYDYFDIEGTIDDDSNEEKRDVIKISVRQEYFSEEIENDDDEDKINFDEDYEKLL